MFVWSKMPLDDPRGRLQHRAAGARLAVAPVHHVPGEHQRLNVAWEVADSFVLEMFPALQRLSNLGAHHRTGCGNGQWWQHVGRGFKSLCALTLSTASSITTTSGRFTSTTTIRST